jgi:hypothetical protein
MLFTGMLQAEKDETGNIMRTKICDDGTSIQILCFLLYPSSCFYLKT